MSHCGIYKITNLINNHAYIGQSVDIDRRFREHKSMNKKNKTLYDAFQKYGINNFNFEILEECDKDLLNEREIYWIDYYDTYNNGYNMTRGAGEGGGKHCKPVAQYDKEGNFIAVYDSILDAERKLGFKAKSTNITNVCQGKAYESKGFQWRYVQDNIDYTLNIGKSKLKEKYLEGNKYTLSCLGINVKKVGQYNKTTNELITIYVNASEASRVTGVCSSGIRRVCNGERKTAGGFIWSYIN